MIILGIDPGTATTGWAIVKVSSQKQELVSSGIIVTSKIKDQSHRLEEIYNGIVQKIREFKPDVVAIEKLFFNTNLKTALSVGQTHGVVRLAAQQAKISTIEYTPLQVKMSITGYGRADKKQIQYMVANILKLPKKVTQDDTADAIAIALCHCFLKNMNKV